MCKIFDGAPTSLPYSTIGLQYPYIMHTLLHIVRTHHSLITLFTITYIQNLLLNTLFLCKSLVIPKKNNTFADEYDLFFI